MQFLYRAATRTTFAQILGLVGILLVTGHAAAQEKQGRQATKAEYDGWRQYMVHCARCHGDDAVGGVMAPDLRGSVAKGRVDQSSFHVVVSKGKRDGGMPGFEGTLSDDQIHNIYAYVNARAKGELAAGRPG
jgi:cytochrome c